MNSDNRNVILAVVLSMVVLFGWQFFIAGPQLEEAQRQAEIRAAQHTAPAHAGQATGLQPFARVIGGDMRRDRLR